jgi:hypothetical protein
MPHCRSPKRVPVLLVYEQVGADNGLQALYSYRIQGGCGEALRFALYLIVLTGLPAVLARGKSPVKDKIPTSSASILYIFLHGGWNYAVA